MSSFIDHRGDGSNKSFLIPFEYYENDQLFAYVDDRLVEIEQYNKNSVVLKDIPPSGSLVRIRRIVDVDTPFATYVTGSDLTEDTLNKNNLKLLYGIQQLNDGFVDDDFYFKQDISMGDNRIIDVADGIDDTDAVNYSQVKNLDANVKQIEQNIIRLEQQTKASKDAAGVSETNAKTSETNAKTSETNAKTSETNAKESELLAKTSKDAAKISETNAKDSELLAKQYADAAKVSETNSKVSETNSKTSETNAKESELLAEASKDAAKVSETNAKTSETNAKTSETNAKTSETNAKDSELLAKKYADESKSTKPDYKTIFIDTAGNIAAKDIAINEDDSDLASNRGQIGKAVLLTNAYSSITDLNTVLKSGIYWITNGIAATLQNCPTTGIGGFLIVSGNEVDTTQQTYHVYNSSNIYTRYIINGTANSWNKVIIDTDSATTSKKGIVQLSSAVNSNSETIAATSKAVKVAYDKAVEAKNAADAAASSIDPWNIFPMRVPIAVDGVTFGGSDGRRAIMPGESVARENWIICDGGSDGKGGTVPDLRGRMILGASSTYAAGSTGGSETHTHSISGNVGATTLNVNQMPSHSHSFTAVRSAKGRYMESGNLYENGGSNTNATGGSGSHTHSLSGAQSSSASSLPPYYSLSYIIKIS